MKILHVRHHRVPRQPFHRCDGVLVDAEKIAHVDREAEVLVIDRLDQLLDAP